jgi:phosphoribosylamine--glycine ligase
VKVLVVGSGGREHALSWKISQSPQLKKLFCAPGNAGMSELAECVLIEADNTEALVQFSKKEGIDLVVVGPEVPLVAGLVDQLEAEGILAFGPNKAASQLEGSKVFSKEKMEKYKIPTAKFVSTESLEVARQTIEEWDSFPVVIKADGLAAGKGVAIPETKADALTVLDDYFLKKTLGDAGQRIVIEECLVGEELSILAITDGKTIVPLASSQDHKRALEGDKGPNTGGMGAYSPCPFITDENLQEMVDVSVTPLIKGLASEGIEYKGLLYAGLMLTEKGPYILEYNVRFGDPETQAVLPRLKTDLLTLLKEAAEGNLTTTQLEWDPRSSIAVVMASGGYPGSYEKGFEITGIDVARQSGQLVFHAGTVEKDGKILTSGGRVLAVTGFGDTLECARDDVYKGVQSIQFNQSFFRRDIAKRMIEKEQVL